MCVFFPSVSNVSFLMNDIFSKITGKNVPKDTVEVSRFVGGVARLVDLTTFFGAGPMYQGVT